ncbi:MAG: response regulator [Balneolaceae bacterium]|nr:MAG: response regulator [Balneolaceae bacterium]
MAGKKMCKVLIVDDDYVNSLMARKMIESFGYEASTAWDGHEAVDMAKTGEFDIILMDLNMPGLDGLQATLQILQQELTSTVPVIAVTADSNSISKGLHTEAGMSDYLLKPFKIEQLKEMIDRYAVVVE